MKSLLQGIILNFLHSIPIALEGIQRCFRVFPRVQTLVNAPRMYEGQLGVITKSYDKMDIAQSQIKTEKYFILLNG